MAKREVNASDMSSRCSVHRPEHPSTAPGRIASSAHNRSAAALACASREITQTGIKVPPRGVPGACVRPRTAHSRSLVSRRHCVRDTGLVRGCSWNCHEVDTQVFLTAVSTFRRLPARLDGAHAPHGAGGGGLVSSSRGAGAGACRISRARPRAARRIAGLCPLCSSEEQRRDSRRAGRAGRGQAMAEARTRSQRRGGCGLFRGAFPQVCFALDARSTPCALARQTRRTDSARLRSDPRARMAGRCPPPPDCTHGQPSAESGLHSRAICVLVQSHSS